MRQRIGDRTVEDKYLALAEESFASDHVLVKNAYIDITNDLIAGIVLSQIMYWFTPSKDGSSKIRVRKQDGYWLAKSREEWYEEIRISPKQFDRALKILKDCGLIETKLYRFNGSPTMHLRPIWSKYNELLAEWKERKAESLKKECSNPVNTPFFPKGKNPISPKGKMEIDDRVKTLTENTTINTPKNTLLNELNGAKTEFCTSILEKEIEKAFRETDIPFNEDIEKAIIYFYKAYKNTFWVEHPRINQKAMNGVINRFSEVGLDLDYEQYVILIDEYFSKECYKADYNICHFATEGILQNLYYETLY